MLRTLTLFLAVCTSLAYSEQRSRYSRRGGAQSYQQTGVAPRPSYQAGQGTIRNNIYYAPNAFTTPLPPNYEIRRSSSYHADSNIEHQSASSTAEHRYDARGDYEVTRRGEPIQSGTTAYQGGTSNHYRTQNDQTLRQKIDLVESEAARHNGVFAEYMHAIANWGNQLHAEMAVTRAAYRRGEIPADRESYALLDFQEDRLKRLMDAARGMGSSDPYVRVATIDRIKGIMSEIHQKYRSYYLQGRVRQSDWDMMESAYRNFIQRADYARSH